MNTWNWFGSSGRPYVCNVLPKDANWNDVPGVYLFVNRPMLLGSVPCPTAVYVGQCNSFLNRICGHERWSEASRLGANEVHALVLHNSLDRDYFERDLITLLRPILNTQFAGLGRLRSI